MFPLIDLAPAVPAGKLFAVYDKAGAQLLVSTTFVFLTSEQRAWKVLSVSEQEGIIHIVVDR